MSKTLQNIPSDELATAIVTSILQSPLAEKLIDGTLDIEKATKKAIEAHTKSQRVIDEWKKDNKDPDLNVPFTFV